MKFMHTDRNKKIEEILNSLDGAKRAAAPDFFYTRLKARMLARHEGEERIPSKINNRDRILRPVYIVSALLLVILINVFVFLSDRNDTTTTTLADNNESVQQSIAAEYSLNDNNAIYDLNQDK
jgi:hypothetical protein